MTLLEQCNADVYKAILDIKAEHPELGEKMISILQSHTSSYYLILDEILWFSAYLPIELWNQKAHTFSLLFKSQQTTTMP